MGVATGSSEAGIAQSTSTLAPQGEADHLLTQARVELQVDTPLIGERCVK